MDRNGRDKDEGDLMMTNYRGQERMFWENGGTLKNGGIPKRNWLVGKIKSFTVDVLILRCKWNIQWKIPIMQWEKWTRR